jgi:gamma-glutamyl:cysteine ligase YbdK (ATP-grasp superfamily)
MEYMIVDKETLFVKPILDLLMQKMTGEFASDWEKEPISWSNELALHVLELKTCRPTETLKGIEAPFQIEVRLANEALQSFNACLLPTAMHPWMRPDEMRLWPHDESPIYQAFNRIFDCRGHGWANLQSTHINLPFADEAEFAKLHAAIRFVLPLIPALAATSPFMEGKLAGPLDQRIQVYRTNAAKIPAITGEIIPEVCLSFQDYEEKIFQPMYQAILPYDPEGILAHEWLNARGAIARFDRGAIEIRLMDIQECPMADVAVAAFLIYLVRTLVEERFCPLSALQALSERELKEMLLAGAQEGEALFLADPRYLKAFGQSKPLSAQSLFKALLADFPKDLLSQEAAAALEQIIDRGSLASQLKKSFYQQPTQERLKGLYHKLADCLHTGQVFA